MAAAAGIWQDGRWIWETSVVAEKLEVKEAAGLLAFLRGHLPGWSGATVKQRLRAGCVRVNGRAVTRPDHALASGDVVEIAAVRAASRPPAELDILFADRDLVAIAKPAGLLSVGTAQESRLHALALLRRQLAPRSHVGESESPATTGARRGLTSRSPPPVDRPSRCRRTR